MATILKYNICGHDIPVALCPHDPDETNRSAFPSCSVNVMKSIIHVSQTLQEWLNRMSEMQGVRTS
jgi:hypothetical protein